MFQIRIEDEVISLTKAIRSISMILSALLLRLKYHISVNEEQILTAEGSRKQNTETANVAFAIYLCVLFTLVETTILTFLAVLMKHILAVSFILVKIMDEICSAWRSFDSPLKSLLPKGSLLTTLAKSNGPALKCPLTAAPLSFPPTCIFASKIELVDFLAA